MNSVFSKTHRKHEDMILPVSCAIVTGLTAPLDEKIMELSLGPYETPCTKAEFYFASSSSC